MAEGRAFGSSFNARRLNDRELLIELGPAASGLLDQHLTLAREWFPHELIPFDRVVWSGRASAGPRRTPAEHDHRRRGTQRAGGQSADRRQPALLLRDDLPVVRCW